MRLIPSTLIALGAVAGISGAAVAYQSATSGEPVVTRPVSDAPDPTPSTVVNLLPCDEGSELRDGVCVRTEDRLVPASPTTSSGSRSAPAAPTAVPTMGPTDDDDSSDDDSSGHRSGRDDHSDEVEDADDDGRHGDDDGPDHDVDDDHGGDSDDDDSDDD